MTVLHYMLEPPGGQTVYQVLARAFILLAAAPSAPVGSWPGARTLSDSVLRRLPTFVRPEHVTMLSPSGSRVVTIPVDGGRPVPSRRPAPPVGPVLAAAPWGEPLVPFAGVTVSTCQIPQLWLRSESRAAEVIPMTRERPVPVPPPAQHATITQFPRRPLHWPAAVDQHRPHGRLRRVATLALSLLVSLVVMEAAARTSRH
jgi:hypothetical protein